MFPFTGTGNPGFDDPAAAMKSLEKMMEDPKGRELMMAMQSNPNVMCAARHGRHGSRPAAGR